MLNDFTWNMTGYIPKHHVNPHGDGIIPYVAERIFQLEPEPPAVGSLPDHWGRLLLDRLLRAHKQNPDELTVLDRLAIVGTSGMGALTYHPEKNFPEEQSSADLDKLAEECQKILNTEYSDKLDELYLLGGTSGGARPKIMTTIDNEEWIIKFPAHVARRKSRER